jgi:hypothetical protein
MSAALNIRIYSREMIDALPTVIAAPWRDSECPFLVAHALRSGGRVHYVESADALYALLKDLVIGHRSELEFFGTEAVAACESFNLRDVGKLN